MEHNQSLFEQQVEENVSANLVQVSRWSKLLAIIIIAGMGLLLLLILALWSTFSQFFDAMSSVPGSNGNIIMITILVMLIIIFAIVGVLMMFLIRGATNIRNGLANKEQVTFNKGLNNLKNYFLMYGILGIIGVLFMLLGLLSR